MTRVLTTPITHPLLAGSRVAAIAAATCLFWAQGSFAQEAFCTGTANAVYRACTNGVLDDFWLTSAKCSNYSETLERTTCVAEARTARTEGSQKCLAQKDFRIQACARLGEARYDPGFDKADFETNYRTPANPNPYFPLVIGHKWEYRSANERAQLELLNETKLIEGIPCIVLRDLVYLDNKLHEATFDWFALKNDRTVWYFGEEVKNYENFLGDKPRRPELVTIDGSFKAGRENDKAGIIFPSSPTVGVLYREEFALSNAEDVAEVLSTTYGFGSNSELDRFVPQALAQRFCGANDCVVTKNVNLTEPGAFALKYYARGIGFFLEIKPDGGEVNQLVSCNFDPRCVGLPQP
jgi:hypothetical protein